MRKQIALFTTVAALAVTPALAQTSTQDKDKQPAAPQAQPSTPPSGGSSAQSPSSSSPSATSPSKMDDKSAAAPKAGAGEKFVNTQMSGQWLASDIMGMNVVGSKDEKIGSVSDLLVDKDGNILAAVVGVGGFLGIGEKEVAVRYEDLTFNRDEAQNVTVVTTLTSGMLGSAPDYERLSEQSVTVGENTSVIEKDEERLPSDPGVY